MSRITRRKGRNSIIGSTTTARSSQCASAYCQRLSAVALRMINSAVKAIQMMLMQMSRNARSSGSDSIGSNQ